MSTPQSIERWIAAERRGDFTAVAELLSPQVQLVSPLTDGFRFAGRGDVMAVFSAAAALLGPLEVTAVSGAGRDWVVHCTSSLKGANLEELRWFRLTDDGAVEHITLFIRPVSAAIALLAALGGPLSRAGVLKPAAAIASRTLVPVAAVLALVERRVMPRLMPTRRRALPA